MAVDERCVNGYPLLKLPLWLILVDHLFMFVNACQGGVFDFMLELLLTK